MRTRSEGFDRDAADEDDPKSVPQAREPGDGPRALRYQTTRSPLVTLNVSGGQNADDALR